VAMVAAWASGLKGGHFKTAAASYSGQVGGWIKRPRRRPKSCGHGGCLNLRPRRRPDPAATAAVSGACPGPVTKRCPKWSCDHLGLPRGWTLVRPKDILWLPSLGHPRVPRRAARGYLLDIQFLGGKLPLCWKIRSIRRRGDGGDAGNNFSACAPR
jgi:hypothetical protein